MIIISVVPVITIIIVLLLLYCLLFISLVNSYKARTSTIYVGTNYGQRKEETEQRNNSYKKFWEELIACFALIREDRIENE
jgi:hypothetical protein